MVYAHKGLIFKTSREESVEIIEKKVKARAVQLIKEKPLTAMELWKEIKEPVEKLNDLLDISNAHIEE